MRDTRGFAVKFSTDEGNFDLVGNNIPVFFIQDGIKFPNVIHAGTPHPVRSPRLNRPTTRSGISCPYTARPPKSFTDALAGAASLHRVWERAIDVMASEVAPVR